MNSHAPTARAARLELLVGRASGRPKRDVVARSSR